MNGWQAGKATVRRAMNPRPRRTIALAEMSVVSLPSCAYGIIPHSYRDVVRPAEPVDGDDEILLVARRLCGLRRTVLRALPQGDRHRPPRPRRGHRCLRERLAQGDGLHHRPRAR